MVYRGGGVITALAGAGMAFLAGRSRSGDTRFRRAAVALSLAIVVLVALVAVLGGAVHVLTLLAVHPADRGDRADHPTCGIVVRPGAAVTESGPPPEVLFYEPGASWWWLLAGPAAGVAMALIQTVRGLRHPAAGPGHLLRAGDAVSSRFRSRPRASTRRSS